MGQTTEVNKTEKCDSISKGEFVHKDNEPPTIMISCDKDGVCDSRKCNFMCKWFVTKNYYLFQELGALKEYLATIPDNYFEPDFSVRIKSVSSSVIPNDIFDYLRDYVEYQ